MFSGKILAVVAAGILGAAMSWPAAEEESDGRRVIAVPPQDFETPNLYGGRTRVLPRSVRDHRLVESEAYLGVILTGPHNRPRPLYGTVSGKESFESALRGALEASHLLASRAEEATVLLDIDLQSLAFAEQVFWGSAYGTAEVLYQASLSAAPSGPEGPEPGVRSLMVRAFDVEKVANPTTYAPEILRDALRQAAERLLASESLGSFIEEESRGQFHRDFPPTPDLEKWIKKSSRVLEPDPNEMAAAPIDLSGYSHLFVGDLKISDKEYGERALVAERQLRLTIYTRLVGALHGKFRTISAGERPPAGKSLILTCDFSEFTPYRPGAQIMWGFWAGHGRISGVMELKDGETGAKLAALPLQSSTGFASGNQIMIEQVARQIASFVAHGKADDPDPLIEVSWAEG